MLPPSQSSNALMTLAQLESSYHALRETQKRRKRSTRRSSLSPAGRTFSKLPTLHEELEEEDQRWKSAPPCGKPKLQLASVKGMLPPPPLTTLRIASGMKRNENTIVKDVKPYMPMRKPVRRSSFEETMRNPFLTTTSSSSSLRVSGEQNTVAMIDQVLSELDLNESDLFALQQ